MALRAVFLDVGRTLVRETPSRYAIYAAAARARGREVDAPRMRTLMREAHQALPRRLDGAFRYSDPWFRAFIAQIFGRELGLGAGAVAGVTEELFARFEDPRTFELFEGARELLATLREEGLVLGVISNWSARLPRVLAALELEAAFDHVLCSALEEAEKPEPTIFERALERAGVAADEALHAGDHLVLDVQGARRAGLAAVLVRHAALDDQGPAKRPEPPPRDVPQVASLPELGACILGRR